MSLTYPEAIVIGALQGVAELFPVSSFGHSILIPALIGHGWEKDLNIGAKDSPYLAFVVGLHVATALALMLFFWRDWVRIIGGLYTSIRYRRVQSSAERLAWLLIIATIPVGLAGLLLEHALRSALSHAKIAAILLALNGLVIFTGERLRKSPAGKSATGRHSGGYAQAAVASQQASMPAAQYARPNPQAQYGQAPPPQQPPYGQAQAPYGQQGQRSPQGQYGAGPQGQYGAGPQGQAYGPGQQGPQGQYGPQGQPGQYRPGPQGQYGQVPPQPQYGQQPYRQGAAPQPGNGQPNQPGYGTGPAQPQQYGQPQYGQPQPAYAQAPQEHGVAGAVGHTDAEVNLAADERISRIGILSGTLIGSAQILALAGLSRSGVTMIAGLVKGLSHQDAARFAFLLATPVILAAGVLKVPELFGPMGNGIHGQIIVGGLLSFTGAYVSVRFLTRYFETRTLTPFAIYCAVFGLGSLAYLSI